MLTNPSNTFTWLHLSDAHLGDLRHAPDAEHVLDTLTKDLKALQRTRGLYPDCVFFTGDAAFGETRESPLDAQYREVARFFDGVCASFEPPVPPQRVFIVPGNHDVNRNEAGEDQREWLENLFDNGEAAEEKVDTLIRRADVQWKRYMERLQSYARFLASAGYSHLLTDPSRLTYTHVLHQAGHRIGIMGLNSAWSCAQDNAKGKVWLGRWQIVAQYAAIRDCDLKVALSHHPFNWLTEHEDPRLAHELSRMFHYHLHGHEHVDWVLEHGGHTRIAAGACYDRITKSNGYNFTRVNLADHSAEIHLRAYDRQGRGWIPHCVHGSTTDLGIWRTQRTRPSAPSLERAAVVTPEPESLPASQPRRQLGAHDFFSPAREIIDADKFVGRRTELAKAVGALRSDGASIAIFGHAGLGKTSLAFQIAHIASGQSKARLDLFNLTHLAPEGGFAHPVVYYCCQASDQTIGHVLTSVLRNAHPPFSTKALLMNKQVANELARAENRELAEQLHVIRSSSAHPESDATSSLPADIRAVFSAFSALVSKAYHDQALVLVLDEFNVVHDKIGMAALLKELHFVTFVLVGTAADMRLLVRDHASVPRQLEEGQIRIREMAVRDLKEILYREEAWAKGRFHFSAAAVLEIVNVASGMPYFVHLLGRYALTQALADRVEGEPETEVRVELSHVQCALADSAVHMADLEQSYRDLTASSWQREFVLKLLACRAEAEIELGNVTSVAKTQGVRTVRSQVDYFIKRGVLEECYGNAVRFRDPRVRVYARVRELLHDANRRRLQFVQESQAAAGSPDWIFAGGATAEDARSRATVLGVRRGRLPKAARNFTR